MKFYETKEFKRLNQKWRKRLEGSGFEDQENEKEVLKTYNRRNQSWDNRDHILEFHLRLASYLSNTQGLNPIERQILSLYSEGFFIKEIVEKVRKSDRYIRNVIAKYKRLIAGFA